MDTMKDAIDDVCARVDAHLLALLCHEKPDIAQWSSRSPFPITLADCVHVQHFANWGKLETQKTALASEAAARTICSEAEKRVKKMRYWQWTIALEPKDNGFELTVGVCPELIAD